MEVLNTIGKADDSISYVDRPTVKVVMHTGGKVLILNDGLLPGGGIDESESDLDAIQRELREELGATVFDVSPIGQVVQYRNFLGMRYVVSGYSAALETLGGETDFQDKGEMNFVSHWLTVDQALEKILSSISRIEKVSQVDDLVQGKLYNLMTSYELLRKLS